MADQNEEQQQGTQTAQISGTVQIKPQGGDPQQGAKKPEEKTVDAPEKNGKRRTIIIAVVAVIALVAGLWYWHSLSYEDTDDAQVDGDLYQVSARVAGQVVHVDVQDEQHVVAGQPIAEIDPRDFQVALEVAQAALANAKAEALQANVNVPITSTNVQTQITTSGQDVRGSEAQVQQSQSQASAAEARVQQAQATALKSKLDVDRYTPLVAKDVISKQQFDQAVATATADQAALDEAQRNVKASQDAVKLQQQRLAISRSQSVQSQKTAGQQVQVQQARASGGQGLRAAGAGPCGPGAIEPELYKNCGADDGHCEQEERGGGQQPERRAGPADHRSSGRPVGDSELQGNATRQNEAGTIRGDESRCTGWAQIPRQGVTDWRSDRFAAKPVPAGECNRQLCEGGAADPSED